MNETEIENLVVRLTGDGSSFQQMTKTATQQATQAATSIEAQSKRIEALAGGMQGFASQALGVLSMLGVAASLQGAFQKYAEAERLTLRLGAAIEATGRNVQQVTADYEAYIRQITSVTLATRGEVLTMLQRAEAHGVSGEAAKRAVTNAIAMAGALGGEAEGYLRVTTAMENGNIHMLQRVLRMHDVKDESEVLARAQKLLGSGFKAAQAEAESTWGQITKLQRSLGSLNRDVGEIVANAIRPLVRGLTDLVNWFNSLDPSVKRATVGVVTVLAAVASMGPILSFLGPILGTLATSFKIVGAAASLAFTPVGAIIATAAVAITLVVRRLGGLEAAWERVKVVGAAAWEYLRGKAEAFMEWVTPKWNATVEVLSSAWSTIEEASAAAWDYSMDRAGEFITWITPVWNEFRDLVVVSWETIRDAGIAAWPQVQEFASASIEFIQSALSTLADFASGIWEYITGGAVLNWTVIRDAIVEALLYAQFSMKNFQAVSEHTWTGIELAFVRTANQIEHFFTAVLPALASWFGHNWRDIFTDVFNFTTTIIGNLVGNIVRVISSIPDLIKGKVTFDELWKPLTEGFESAIKELPDIPQREVGQLEQALREVYDAQSDELARSFEEFKADKVKGLAEAGDAVRAATREVGKAPAALSPEIPNSFKKATAEIQKFDAALVGSAEAITRLQQYEDSFRIDKKTGNAAAAAANIAGAANAAPVAIEPARPAPLAGDRVVELLTQAVKHLQTLAEREPIVVEGAGI